MRASGISIALAAAATAVLVGCGSSATSSAAPASAAATPAAASGVTGQAICDAVPATQVEAALGTRVADGTADDSKAAIHACGWIGANGKAALVTVVFDNPDGHQAIKSHLTLTNGIAGTDFSTVSFVANDVLDHEVAVYRLSNDVGVHSTSGLDPISSNVRDLVRAKAGVG